MSRLRISYFGCIDPNYTRNKTNIDGLRQAGAIVHEITSPTPVTALNSRNHTAAFKLLHRLVHKLSIFPVIAKKWRQLSSSEIIFVGYPGQFDVPFAFIIAKLFRKKLVFDPVILMFYALSNDIGVFGKRSNITKLLRMYEGFIMRLPDMIIASTIEQKQFFVDQLQLDPSKIEVFYLAADDKLYYPKKHSVKKKHFLVIYYGLFSPLHGVEHILKAAELCGKKQKIQFQMLGSGQLYAKMRAYADEKHLTNVSFLPQVTEKNALSYLQKADVLFGFLENNPTMLREIPNKVYQGAAMGKAIITAESPAVRTVFQPGQNIILIPPGSPRDIARVILDLADRPSDVKMIGRNAYHLYQSQFTPRRIGEEMLMYFQSLAAGKVSCYSARKTVALDSHKVS